jgi:hypothetical protein
MEGPWPGIAEWHTSVRIEGQWLAYIERMRIGQRLLATYMNYTILCLLYYWGLVEYLCLSDAVNIGAVGTDAPCNI